MKKFLLIFAAIFLVIAGLIACSSIDSQEESEGQVTEEDDTEETEENETETLDIDEQSERIIEALDNRDMKSVAEYVHPDKGLLFSQYIYVTNDSVTFKKDEVASLMGDEEEYTWGTYDGRGGKISLTPEEYFDVFLPMEFFVDPDDVIIDDLQDRGNTKNNLDEVYPNARFVEFYNEGSEEYAGIDWESIILVFEPDESNELKLVAIVRDMWTI